MGAPVRLIAAIALGAGAVFAVLWWRAAQAPAPPVVAALPAAPRAAVPARGDAPAPPPVTGAAPTPVLPLVPAQAAARGQIANDFHGLKLPTDVLDALAEARVAAAVERLWATRGGDAALALDQVLNLCRLHGMPRPYSVSERVAAGLADESTPTARSLRARIEESVREEDAWRARFAADCARAGIDRAETRERLERRLVRCAEEGHADCVFRALGKEMLTPAQRFARLQSAAVLGSTDAMHALVGTLERSADSSPAARDTARYWREQLLARDPEYRVAQLSCVGPDCAPLAPDDATRQLLGALREGSRSALALLAMPPTVAAAASAASAGTPVSNHSDVDAYAWAAVAERLVVAGCGGFWPNWAYFVGRSDEIERALSPAEANGARAAADGRWQAYGPQLAGQWGCAAGIEPAATN